MADTATMRTTTVDNTNTNTTTKTKKNTTTTKTTENTTTTNVTKPTKTHGILYPHTPPHPLIHNHEYMLPIHYTLCILCTLYIAQYALATRKHCVLRIAHVTMRNAQYTLYSSHAL